MSKTQPNLNRLTRKRKTGNNGGLGDADGRQSIGAYQSTGRAAGDSSGGTDFPLNEVSERLYYDESSITSSEGLFVLTYKRPKRMFFEDASKRDAEIGYLDPNA